MDQEHEFEIPDWDRLVEITNGLFESSIEDLNPHYTQVTLEQIRSSLRDQLELVDLDAHDVKQLKCVMIGALLAIHTQMPYTPIGHVSALVPKVALEMIDSPAKNETEWTSLALLLRPPQVVKNRRLKFRRFTRTLLGVKGE
jgi:hypothetical protein